MKKIIILFILGIVVLASGNASIFADYKGDIDRCLRARCDSPYDKPGCKVNTASIKDFYCPSDDVDAPTGIDHRIPGAVEYLVIMSKMMKEQDEKSDEKVRKLQDKREKDPVQWMTTINTLMGNENSSQTGITTEYTSICDKVHAEILKLKIPVTSDSQISKFLEERNVSPCIELARKKSSMYKNMSFIMANRGIVKSYENDKDEFVNRVTGAYLQIQNVIRWYKENLIEGMSKLVKSEFVQSRVQ